MLKQSVRWLGIVVLVPFLVSWANAATSTLGARTQLTGEQKQWHTVTLTFAGPQTSESASTNPFRNFRLNVTLTHVGSGRTMIVPGFYAADGDAANTSANSGNRWRVHFTPDATGTWNYRASFRTGTDVAISTATNAGSPGSFDGEAGSFTVDPTNKTGADFRGKGRLQEVGQHYLQFSGSKEYFIKHGAGSPENFLAFADFDNTTAGKKPLHFYTTHLSHFQTGNPTWKGGKGRAIIGAVNYLSSKHVNSQYFLTMNVGGDGDDVFPWTQKTERYRFDVSKLAQWEIVFGHMEARGIHLLVMTQETENDQLLDGGNLGIQRKLYYRELIARFGHHLGVTWNLGEETTNTAAQRDSYASYINALDPYFHLIAVHTYPQDRTAVYTAMLGNPLIAAASLQIESPDIVHAETLKWVSKSATSGEKWIVSVDELGPAGTGAVPDLNDPSHANIMRRVMWGSLLAGGAGVEWYFGYNYAHSDLTCEDWTSRDKLWTLSHHAAQFIRDYMPLPLVANYDGRTSSTVDYCFGKPGVAYAIYLPSGARTSISLPAGESYSVRWFNPRTGGALVSGTVAQIPGGTADVGQPPSEMGSDWVALLSRVTSTGGTVSPPAPLSPSPTPTLAVAELVLIDAASQRDLRKLQSGGVISQTTDGVALNIRAGITGTVGSVEFVLDGQRFRTENAAPFALAGDSSGVYNRWSPALGSHVLRVIPYSGADRSGTLGVPLEITFSVVR